MASCWGSLPEELVRRIAACLPVDARLAAAATCSAWREALRCSAAWTALDLSPASGVSAPVNEALLRAASRRGRGALRSLDLSGAVALPLQAVRAVIWASSGALARVHLEGHVWLTVPDVQALLRVGGEGLKALHADIFVWLPALQDTQDVLALIAAGQLVVHGVNLRGYMHMEAAAIDGAVSLLRSLTAGPDARLRVRLEGLGLQSATPAQRAALLDALRSLSGVREFSAKNCGLTSDALPAVTAAATGQLRTLSLCDEPTLLADDGALAGDGAVAALGALLAANARSLELLTLRGVCAEGESAGGLVRAVCGGAALPALKELRLGGNGCHPDHEADGEGDGEADDEGDDEAYDDDSSSADETAGDPAPLAPPAPPVGDEAGCGEACAALLASSRALTLMSLPWLLAASLTPMLSRVPRRRTLTRLELQVRDVSDDWLRLRLFPALELRPLVLELEARSTFRMYASSACAQNTRLRNQAEEAEYCRERMEKKTPVWDEWPRASTTADGLPGSSFMDDEGELDWRAYEKAADAWHHRRACALRGPRSCQRPWQLGSRDFGALPACVIQRIWSLLDLRARIACISVCRAWRTGFAPADGFDALLPPADADGLLLHRLTPVCSSLQQFSAADCDEHALQFEDIEAFLWSTACRRTLDVELPELERPCTVEQVKALLRLSKHTTLISDVTASSGAELQQCFNGGLAARSLTLSGDDGAWDAESALKCIASFCTRAAPYNFWRTGCREAPPLSLCISSLGVKWAPRRPGYDAASAEDAERFAALERVLGPLARARLAKFEAFDCRLTRRFVPAVCSLLRSGVRVLSLCGNPRLLKRSKRADQGSVALLAAAIRDAPQLRELLLRELDFATQADIAILIAACTGHATLSMLDIELTSKDGGHAREADAALVGAALAALVAAGAPALETLLVFGDVTAAQVMPLAAALRRGGHSISECTDVHELHGDLLSDAVDAAEAARDAAAAAQ